MNNLSEMHSRISSRVSNRINKFCSPLVDNFGVSHFYHAIYMHNNYFAALGLNQEWHEDLFSNELWGPAQEIFFRNQSKNFFLSQTNHNTAWEQLANIASENYEINLNLHIPNKIKGGIECFGFALKSNAFCQQLQLLDHIQLLHIFIREYKKEFNISMLKDNLADVSFIVNRMESNYDWIEQRFLKELNVKDVYTKREIELIPFLLNGCSATQIGKSLSLSKRTAEHHIERLKMKMNCSTKSELILKLREMEKFGF
jgi:DNA-binding CsgD family transcriptional regulator